MQHYIPGRPAEDHGIELGVSTSLIDGDLWIACRIINMPSSMATLVAVCDFIKSLLPDNEFQLTDFRLMVFSNRRDPSFRWLTVLAPIRDSDTPTLEGEVLEDESQYYEVRHHGI